MAKPSISRPARSKFPTTRLHIWPQLLGGTWFNGPPGVFLGQDQGPVCMRNGFLDAATDASHFALHINHEGGPACLPPTRCIHT